METMTQNRPFQNQKPIFRKLENIADMVALSPAERNYYHISLDSYRTNMACMEHGRNEGRAEGRIEVKMEIIRQLAKKLDNIQIASLLNLDVKDIEEVIRKK